MWPKSFGDVVKFVEISSLILVCIALTDAAMAHFSAMSVGGIGEGTVTYSVDNSENGSWTKTLALGNPSAAWYSRFETGTADYSGSVTITWQLQQKTGASGWIDVAGSTSTFLVLSGVAQNVYATGNGVYTTDNHNWGEDVAAAGTYRVVVTVLSA